MTATPREREYEAFKRALLSNIAMLLLGFAIAYLLLK